MLLHFLVASVQAGPRSKNIELGLRYSSQFNQDLAASDQALAAFCFPLGPDAQAPKEYMASEEYTFTLTKSDGSRFSGFCRRFLPPVPKQGPKLRYAKVICLITEAPWFVFFSKVLQSLEHLVKQSELLDARDMSQLPTTSAAGQFLNELAQRLDTSPQLGSTIRVPMPPDAAIFAFSPPKRGGAAPSNALASPDTELELHVPQDCGNGSWNAGVSMARLLYHVPIPAMLTLIASMLLERRIILVGQSRDMVSAAVHAAHAFLYPFRWHHIFLPLLPKHFKDYLTAPMPFLVGMPAQLLPCLKGIPMNEVTMIDLDLAKCEPMPGSRNDDALLLPWRDRLELALHTAYSQLRSPIEYESNPLITGIMQEYFLKLVGNYRKFVIEMDPSEQTRSAGRTDDGIVYGDGMKFDHGAFVNSFRGLERAKNFLRMFRHSQLYEVFIQERLQLARQNYVTDDIFECKVLLTMERRTRVQEMSSKVQAGYNKTVNKLGSIIRKHARNTSMDSSSWDLPPAGQRGLARAHTDTSAGRVPNPGASTPASTSGHQLPPLVDLHQLFESESDAESDLSTFSNTWGRHSDSGNSDLDRISTGPARAESSGSMDPDNVWRGVNGSSSTASTPKPVQVSNLISLDEDHPPLTHPPDSSRTQSRPAFSAPNLAPPPCANPFSSSSQLPPQCPPSHLNPSPTQAKQPTATARFMSILDAALASATEGKQTAARPPSGSPPPPPSGTAVQTPRISREYTFGSMLASYGKDAWSELTSVARDVRESVREVRQTLGRSGTGNLQTLSSPSFTVPPSPHIMPFSSVNTAVPEPSKQPVQQADRSPSHKLVDDFLNSSMVTLGLSTGTKPAHPQPGPSLQQLRSQSSLDALAQQAALAVEHPVLSRTCSGMGTQVSTAAPLIPSAQPVTASHASVPSPAAWDPFGFLASSSSALPSQPPAVKQPSPTPLALYSPPAAPPTAPSTSTWDPFAEASRPSTSNPLFPGPTPPQLGSPTGMPHTPALDTSSMLSFTSHVSSPPVAAPPFKPSTPAVPLPTPNASTTPLPSTSVLAEPAIHSDPFAALASSPRPGAAAGSSSSMGPIAGLHGAGSPPLMHPALLPEISSLL